MRCDLWHRDSGHVTQRFRDIANRIVGEKNFHHKRFLTHRNLLLWTIGNRKEDIKADSLPLVYKDVLALAFNMYVNNKT